MGTKSDAHLRNFYLDYRRKYNLDSVLKEYEAVNGPITDTDDVSFSLNLNLGYYHTFTFLLFQSG